MRPTSRRAFLSGLAVAACARAEAEDGRREVARGEVGTRSWTFGPDERVVALSPAWGEPGERFPVVIALNGRGEANLYPEHGVLAWPHDYNLIENIRRIANPPLRLEHFEGHGDPDRIATVNRGLVVKPFRGFVVLCVRTPDIHLRKPDAIRAFGDYLLGTVLPRARRELPVIASPRATGITGWSIGGALAMRIGLANADQFSAISGIQAAIAEDQIPSYLEQAREARRRSPSFRLRMVAGTNGYFDPATTKLSAAWREGGFEHELLVLPGPHDYSFIRGNGALETLFWHDRSIVGV